MSEMAKQIQLGSRFGCGADVTRLNSGCFCITLDKQAVRRAFESELGAPDLADLIEQRCPNIFANRPVFVAEKHIARMAQLIDAIEAVVALPAYREEVLRAADATALHDAGGAKSAFFGYDFHVGEDGIALIEINTNAGGAILNAVVSRAQRACCPEVSDLMPAPVDAIAPEQVIIEMFRNEWMLAGSSQALRSIAIVDENPEQQYMYPEFLLFRHLFEQNGLHVAITGPEGLEWRDGRLWHGTTVIDMVYNRLTDFGLTAPANGALRAAYLANAAVVTPHPRAHALYANKRNLALLSDSHWLEQIGVERAVRDILLDGIPRTEVVRPENAERLWGQRRHLFFKPSAGFGGRATYRGDKLTKRVWEEILAGDYVAQSLVAPGERMLDGAADAKALKFDVRAYAYDGKLQSLAARLYRGQTTNFRTPGGGFAPVYPVSESATADNGFQCAA